MAHCSLDPATHHILHPSSLIPHPSVLKVLVWEYSLCTTYNADQKFEKMIGFS
jgi:hypothetical protein